jgi:hypothetical protein
LVELLGALAGCPASLQELHLSIEFRDPRIQFCRMPFEFVARRAFEGQFRAQALDVGSEQLPFLAQGREFACRQVQVACESVAGRNEQQQ